MKAKVYSIDGSEKNEIELSDNVFGIESSMGSIYFSIRNELANRRVGTASTKTRSEVAGSHQKMYRQKGTGRARMGTKRSPVRVGGGIAFGPKPRSFNYKVPRKVKRLAVRSILSMKNRESRLRIIEDFSIDTGKTKELAKLLGNHVNSGINNVVLVLKDNDRLTRRAGANIPWLHLLAFDKLNVHDLFYGQHLLMLESAALKLNDFYS